MKVTHFMLFVSIVAACVVLLIQQSNHNRNLENRERTRIKEGLSKPTVVEPSPDEYIEDTVLDYNLEPVQQEESIKEELPTLAPTPVEFSSDSSDSSSPSPLPSKQPVEFDESGFKEFTTKFGTICDFKASTTKEKEGYPNLKLVNFTGINEMALRAEENETLKEFCEPGLLTKMNYPIPIRMCVFPREQDDRISASILDGKLWDVHVVQAFEKLESGKPGIIIDAGANIGTMSLVAAALGHQVISFEPVSKINEMFIKSVALNQGIGLDQRIHLFRNGLGWNRIETHAIVDATNKGATRLNRRHRRMGNEDENDVISVIRLDDILSYIEDNIPDSDVLAMKVDVESFEPFLLHGGRRFLFEKRPPLIIMEVQRNGWTARGCSVLKTLQAMDNVGYDIYFFENKMTPHEVYTSTTLGEPFDLFLKLRM